MFDDFGGGGELAEVVADHFGGDGEGEEFLTVVDGEADADHFGEDDHIAAVGAEGGFVLEVLGFDLPDFFEEADVAGGEAAAEGAALAGGEEADDVVHGEFLELFGGKAAVGEFTTRHGGSGEGREGGH